MLLPPNRADRVRVPRSAQFRRGWRRSQRQCQGNVLGQPNLVPVPWKSMAKWEVRHKQIVKKMELDPTNDKRIGI